MNSFPVKAPASAGYEVNDLYFARRIAMPTFRPSLATYVETLTRSFLLSLGLDHVLIDFLMRAAIGAAAVLLAILFVGARTTRHR